MKGTKTKKIISVLLSLVMVLGIVPLSMFTASAATDGVLMYSVSGEEATIIGCDSDAVGDVIIPDTLGGYPVTAISLYAFAECESITGVSIPDSVKKVGHYAFSDCVELKVVLIGKNVTEMGNNVFSNCTGLERFSVASDNPVYSSDENGVLYNKNKTELLIYPASNLSATYTVAENVKTIADSTFAGSKNVKTIVIVDNVTTIGANAFLGSRSLETVVIGKGVTTIGGDAFEGCEKLTGISVSADNTVYCSDENGVLYNKAKTEIIKYPAGNVKKAFTVPAGIDTLRVLSFSNAVNLESVTIGKSVKTIGASAFYGCINITDVYYEGSEAEWKAINIGSNNNAILGAKITFAGGEEHAHSYKSSVTTAATCTQSGLLTCKCDCGHTYTETIPAKGHAFNDNVCSACSLKEFDFTNDGTNAKITAYNGIGGEVVIPETIEGYKVNAIADNAFENKTAITSITLPASVKDIGSCAFYKTGYYNTSSNWENGVLYIGTFLIEANDKVKGAYTVKEGTTVIADFAFASRNEVTSINLPATLEVVGDSAFAGCTAIKDVVVDITEEDWKNVVIGTGNEALTGAAFTYKIIPHVHDFKVIEDVKATCTEAGYKVSKCECGEETKEDFAALGHKFVNNVCSGCDEREFNISISGDEVTVLGCHASLSGDVKIPETISGYKVTAIGEKAFADNKKIEKLTIPSGVKKIGKLSFAGSTIVVEVAGENTEFLTDNGILYNKTKLEIIYCPASKAVAETVIPAGVTVIGAGAFYGASVIESVKLPDSIVTIGEDAFAGCTGIKKVVFDGTKTQWSKVAIEKGNDALTKAAITYLDVSDVELADALAKDLAVTGATVKAEEIVIVITADKDTVEISKKTASEKTISIKTESTAIEETEEKYILTFAEWHKAGNKTETEITVDGDTYTIKFVFPVDENNGHDYSLTEKLEATCVLKGATRHTCSICGDFYDTDVTPALGHVYGSWYIEKDETCDENGVKVRECTVCSEETEGHFDTGVVLAKGHNYTSAVTAPTCTEGGYTTFTCSVCSDSYTGNQKPATGHIFGEWTVITDATCEADGEQTHTCKVCSEEVKDKIPATGHKYTGVVTAPTTTTKGYTTYTCDNCGDKYVDDYVDEIAMLVSVEIQNVTIYKDDVIPVNPAVEKYGNVEYTITYEIEDESIVTIDEDGNLIGLNRGVTQIKCIVTDDKGNEVTDICSVEVKFTVIQWITWIIADLLFGFLKNIIPQ